MVKLWILVIFLIQSSILRLMRGISLITGGRLEPFEKLSKKLESQWSTPISPPPMMDWILSNYSSGLNPGSSSTTNTSQTENIESSVFLHEIRYTRILILGKDKFDCRALAANWYLNPEQWVVVTSIDVLKGFDPKKYPVCLANQFYKNPSAQKIIRWARKQGFAIL